MKKCFVIMPIGSGETYEIFINRYENIIKPAIEGVKVGDEQVYQAIRGDFISQTGSITRAIIQYIYSSDAVIADLSGLNPNVFYELGVRHSLRNKTVLIGIKETTPPFDVGDLRIVWYEDKVGGEKKAIPEIQSFLKSFLEGDELIDSPIFQAIPELKSRGENKEESAKLYALQQENENLKTKLAVAEQTTLSLQQSISSISATVSQVLSKLDEGQKQITEDEIDKLLRKRQQIVVSPKAFKVRDYEVDERQVLVLIPFSKEFEDIYHFGIVSACNRAGLKTIRYDLVKYSDITNDQIYEIMLRSGLVVAELTNSNPNILYQVGIANTLGKETILIARKGSEIPFNIRNMRIVFYSQIKNLEMRLYEALKQYLNSIT
jgi:hypothetical protein